MNSSTENKGAAIKIVTENRKARFEYVIIETFEAGIVLTGAEIKSVRADGVSLSEAYVRPEMNACYLLGAHIKPYSFSSKPDYEPTRARKLLLHKKEMETLKGRVEEEGLTVIPLKLYLKKGRAKVEIALAKGKQGPDKRQSIKKREGQREVSRALKERHR